MTQSDLEASFAFHWRILFPDAPEPVAQHRGIEGRWFAWDFAWPDQHVAVECQGGTWATGQKQGHTRGSMYEKDCHKLCLAVAQGWRVFWLTTTMLRNNPQHWLGLIAEMIGAQTE